jgi:GH24 family phage-related lysozyme (muramidase)
MSQLSDRGAEFIGRFEGWRDQPYNDVANNATIGYGHLIHQGPVSSHDKTEWGTLSKAA